MEPGSILAGRYELGEVLGRGGMGIVVKAIHTQLGTPVAIKLLKRDAAEEPDLVARFLREARSAARLRGEHVCRVTDFGQADDGTPFMVMEYLDGEDLKTILDAHGPIDAPQMAAYILQACIGVAEAHALGIIHRDLKPGNLFVIKQPDGRRSLKLLDFGIAKSRAGTVDGALTNTAKAMGSPAYMSPEQLKGADVDVRSDVWSLGITMFELLTERRPFEGDTPYELAIAIHGTKPAVLPDTIPPEIAKIVMRCLEKDPKKRYQNVSELAAALAPHSKHGQDLATQAKAALVQKTGVSEHVRASREVDANPATETTLRAASGAVTAIPRRSRTKLAIALGVIVAAAAAAAILVMGQNDNIDDVAPAASPMPATPAEPVAIPPPDPTPAPPPDPTPAPPSAGSAEPVDPPPTEQAPQVPPPDETKPEATKDESKKGKRDRKKGRKGPKPDFGSSRW